MEIKLDGNKLLTEIFELDGSIHKEIKQEVRRRLIDSVVDEIESKYFKNSWDGALDEINNDVLEEIKNKQEEVIKKILRDFYDGYRYGKKDVTILKKLKELLEEE